MSDYVTPEQVSACCTVLGLEPDNVLEVNVSAVQVWVTEFVRDADGNISLATDGTPGFRKRTRLLPVRRTREDAE